MRIVCTTSVIANDHFGRIDRARGIVIVELPSQVLLPSKIRLDKLSQVQFGRHRLHLVVGGGRNKFFRSCFDQTAGLVANWMFSVVQVTVLRSTR